METLGDKFVAFYGKKSTNEYYCKYCQYKCFKKYNWIKHLATSKHYNGTKGDKLVANSGKKGIFICEFCDKEYQHRQCLWRHTKNCIEKQENAKERLLDKDIFMLLLQQNNELIKEHSNLKEIILEIIKNGTNNTTNNSVINNTNSHNKAFKLNFFLNETCKNAMNITDFVDSIKLQLSDFMEVGKIGYVEGISNIIVSNLNALDETVRPIHCTDQKREIFYVKDENRWEKEEEDKKGLKKLIKRVTFKNENLINTYKEKYPDYNDPQSKRSDQYSKTVIEAMDYNEESKEKIIKNISRVTIIKSKL